MVTLVITLVLASFVGVALGLLGGGGSILTLPIFQYVVGMEAHAAVASSLFVVAVTSLAALIPHARAGRVAWRTGLLFGVASMLGAFIVGRVAKHIPAELLLIAFALMMIVTALAMLRGKRMPEVAPRGRGALAKIALEGLAVGGVTGLVGAGGGFLVVPALVLLGGLPMQAAVGTSLLVIALKSFAGFAGHATQVELAWPIVLGISAAALVGSFVGARVAGRVPAERLRRGFGWFVVLMAVFILARELPPLLAAPLGDLSRMSDSLFAPLAGGALIGLAAALVLLTHGRIAGVSGIFGGLLERTRGAPFRMAFIAGLVLAGLGTMVLAPELVPSAARPSLFVAAVAGVLVGFGTRLGNGCTSGHGICCVSRGSPRSLVATSTRSSSAAPPSSAWGGGSAGSARAPVSSISAAASCPRRCSSAAWPSA